MECGRRGEEARLEGLYRAPQSLALANRLWEGVHLGKGRVALLVAVAELDSNFRTQGSVRVPCK